MPEVQRIVRFVGGVSCRRDEGPLGLTLIGRTVDRPDEIATLAFSGTAPPRLPEALEDVTVEPLGEGQYRIGSGRREWTIPARSVHLHREVATIFYRAVAPRTAPWTKRLFWRVVLALASSRAGKRLLLILRGSDD
jgi:hypothetical protein